MHRDQSEDEESTFPSWQAISGKQKMCSQRSVCGCGEQKTAPDEAHISSISLFISTTLATLQVLKCTFLSINQTKEKLFKQGWISANWANGTEGDKDSKAQSEKLKSLHLEQATQIP